MTTSNLLANNRNDLVFWDSLKNEFGCSSVCVEYDTLFTVHIHRRSEVGSAVKLGFCQLRSNIQYPFFTLAVRGLEEHVRVSLIFTIIVSFMLFTVFTLVLCTLFQRISDSRFTWIHDFEE
jgi:hypothetical protein